MKCGQKTTRKSLYSRCQCTSIIDTEVKSAKTVVYSRKQDGHEESVFHLCISYAKDIVSISSVRKNNAYIYTHMCMHTHTHNLIFKNTALEYSSNKWMTKWNNVPLMQMISVENYQKSLRKEVRIWAETKRERWKAGGRAFQAQGTEIKEENRVLGEVEGRI